MGLFSITRRKVAVVATVAVMGLGGGIVYAYFTGIGSGSGAGSVGSSASWGVVVTPDTSNALYPNSGSEDLTYTVTNTGGGNQKLQTLTPSVVGNGSCLASWFTATLNNDDSHGPGSTIAKNGTDVGTVHLTMQESGTDQSACQTAPPSVKISAT